MPEPQLALPHFRASRPSYFKACHPFGTAYGMAVNQSLSVLALNRRAFRMSDNPIPDESK